MKKLKKSLSILFFVSLVMSFIWAFDQKTTIRSFQMRTILTNCTVIDCTGKAPIKNMTVVIEGNKITRLEPGIYKKKPGDQNIRIFNLEGGYVLPGLWNVHVHLEDLFPDPNHIMEGEPLVDAVIRAGRNTMDGLRRGFTGLRDVGERNYLDVAWREAFDKGVFVGPRIFACGPPITATGGHGWEPIGPAAIQIDGPYEMRKAVRENIKHGVDWIKIMDTELRPDEIKAAVETSHQRGLRVCAHSGEPTAYQSVQAGVDCLEHGYGLKDETIKLMAEKNVFYVPTIICNLSAEYIRERERRLAKLGFAENEEVVKGRIMVAPADERSPERALYQRKVLLKAVKAGVKVCTGSDSNPIGEIGILEIEQFVLSGLTEMQALIAATRNCADLCGVLDKLGTVEEGKLADLIVVSDNPLENISNLRKLKMVIKDGGLVNLKLQEGQKSFWEFFF